MHASMNEGFQTERPHRGGNPGPRAQTGIRDCTGGAAADAGLGVVGFGFGLVGIGILIAIAAATPLEPTKGVLQSVVASEAVLRCCGGALFIASVVALFKVAAKGD